VYEPLGNSFPEISQVLRLYWFVWLGATDQMIGGVYATLAEPLPVIPPDGPHRTPHLQGHLEYGGGELRPGVAVVMPIDEGRPTSEQVGESLHLDSE
jgi:hypothetical protein